MAAVLKHWREAATLILVTSSKFVKGASTPRLTSANSEKIQSTAYRDNFDVLLLRRSSSSKFMPNMYVFPGGAAVNDDFSAKWLSVFSKLGTDTQQALFKKLSEGPGNAAPLFSRQRDPAFSIIPSEVAFRICAIRETFEESGVLLALPSEQSKPRVNSFCEKNGTQSPSLPSVLYQDSSVINVWRKRVNENPNNFLNMCLELDLIPEIWSLYEWSDWLTPTVAAENRRRFDTVFFICCVDHKPDAVEDAAETVNVLWASPSSLLSAYYEQGTGLAAPQLYELSRLVNFESASEVLKFVSQPSRSRVQRWLPYEIVSKDSYYMTALPGDDLYPKQEDPYTKGNYRECVETLDELNIKYPNRHRMIHRRLEQTFDVHCTVVPPQGHVNPATSILESIRIKAKL